MKRSEMIHYNIQEQGKINVEAVADCILKDLVPILGHINLPSNMSSMNKIYVLLGNGYYPYMQPVLDKYGYDYGVELQHLMRNIADGESYYSFEQLRNSMIYFPTIDEMSRDKSQYCLDTRLGTIRFTPLTRYVKDSKINAFALQYEVRKFCHVASLEFIKANPDYRAITSLIANQFGEQYYHSYVETSDGYADFANNIHLSKEDYNKVMQPEILNQVRGFDLKEQEQQLTSEDLPDNKTLLLRLAVHNQIKA